MTTRRSLLSGILPTVTLTLADCTTGGTADQTAAPSKTPVSLRYVHQWGAPFTPQLDKIMADFSAKTPNVRAEQVRTNGEIHEALVKALAGGEPPDVTMLWRSNMPVFAGKDAVAEFFGRARKNTHQALITCERAMYVTNHSLPSNAVLVPALQYGISLLPRGSQNGARGIVRGGWANAIPKGVPAARESWLLLQYLSASKEGGG